MNVVVQGLLVDYQQLGKGKDIVILHGWGDAAGGFNELAKALSGNFRVTSFDLPGFGRSQSPHTAFGLNDYAQFVADFMHKLELTPYIIVGHSNGGAIALRGLAQKMFACYKLILLASAGVRGKNGGRKRALWLAAKVGKIASAPLSAKAKSRLRRSLYATAGSDLLVMSHLQESFKKVVADDVRKDAAQVHIPTLLIYGDQDAETPVTFGKELAAQLADSRLEVLPGASHFVHRDEPQATMALISDFAAR